MWEIMDEHDLHLIDSMMVHIICKVLKKMLIPQGGIRGEGVGGHSSGLGTAGWRRTVVRAT